MEEAEENFRRLYKDKIPSMNFGSETRGWEFLYKGIISPFENKFRTFINSELQKRTKIEEETLIDIEEPVYRPSIKRTNSFERKDPAKSPSRRLKPKRLESQHSMPLRSFELPNSFKVELKILKGERIMKELNEQKARRQQYLHFMKSSTVKKRRHSFYVASAQNAWEQAFVPSQVPLRNRRRASWTNGRSSKIVQKLEKRWHYWQELIEAISDESFSSRSSLSMSSQATVQLRSPMIKVERRGSTLANSLGLKIRTMLKTKDAVKRFKSLNFQNFENSKP
jgi:hypothetical protein